MDQDQGVTVMAGILGAALLLLAPACASLLTTPLKDCAALCRTNSVDHYFGDSGEQCACRGLAHE